MNVCFTLNYYYKDSNSCKPIKFSGCVVPTDFNIFTVGDAEKITAIGERVTESVKGLIWDGLVNIDHSFQIPELQEPAYFFAGLNDINEHGVQKIAEKIQEFVNFKE